MIKDITITKRRGRPKKQVEIMEPEVIDFSGKVEKLSKLNIDSKMLETMLSGTEMDDFISHEGGLGRATNLIFGGGKGVGKTTTLLYYLAHLAKKGANVAFISGEMGRKNMFKYKKRFPVFDIIETLFMGDYMDYNSKNVVEQFLDRGYDIVLIDSLAEVIGLVRDDNSWDKKTAEKWLVKICTKQNEGNNKNNSFTSFLGIQQLNVSNGELSGGNKLAYLFDGDARLVKNKETGDTYMYFEKNRDGKAGEKLQYKITNNTVFYSVVEEKEEEENEEDN